jgi:hypothetical protein
MASPDLPPITDAQEGIRLDRIKKTARMLGFVGRVEYRHVYSRTGGAQYGQGRTAESDLLIVYAEAFERDADPEDFSLTAILAHERGHQLVSRHPQLAKIVTGKLSVASEEILAALLGSILCEDTTDQDNLKLQAAAILADCGEAPEVALKRIQNLRTVLKEFRL